MFSSYIHQYDSAITGKGVEYSRYIAYTGERYLRNHVRRWYREVRSRCDCYRRVEVEYIVRSHISEHRVGIDDLLFLLLLSSSSSSSAAAALSPLFNSHCTLFQL